MSTKRFRFVPRHLIQAPTLGVLCLLLVTAPLQAASTHGLASDYREILARDGDMLSPFVVSGCNPTVPSPGSLTVDAFACAAYARTSTGELAYINQASTTLTVPDSATVWLAIYHQRLGQGAASAPTGWTGVSGTHFMYQAVTARPDTPDGALLFAEVTVAGSVITAMADLRPLTPTHGIPVEAFASFADAIDAYDDADDPNVTLTVRSRQAVATTDSVPTNITLRIVRPGLLDIAAGVTLTACIDAGPYTIKTGAGTLAVDPDCTPKALWAWWGASPNATAANNTIFLQQAINSGASVVEGQAGTYQLDGGGDGAILDGSRSGWTFRGQGADVTILESVNDADDLIELSNTPTGQNGLPAEAGTVSDVVIEHLTFTHGITSGEGEDTGMGISAGDANATNWDPTTRITIQHCRFRQIARSAIKGWRTPTEWTVQFNSFFEIKDGGIFFADGSRHLIMGNRLSTLGDDGIAINDDSNSNRVIGNSIRLVGTETGWQSPAGAGIRVHGQGNIIAHNRIDGVSTSGIRLTEPVSGAGMERNLVSTNHITNVRVVGGGATHAGIAVETLQGELLIVGNYVEAFTSGDSALDGLRAEGGQAGSSLVIVNNVFQTSADSSARIGLNIRGNYDHVAIRGNKIRNNSSSYGILVFDPGATRLLIQNNVILGASANDVLNIQGTGSVASLVMTGNVSEGRTGNWLTVNAVTVTALSFAGNDSPDTTGEAVISGGGAITNAYGVYTGATTYDPPNLVSGGTTTTTVSVPRAAMGAVVDCSHGVSQSSLIIECYMSSAGTVGVLLYNPTGGAIDLASSTLRVRTVRWR